MSRRETDRATSSRSEAEVDGVLPHGVARRSAAVYATRRNRKENQALTVRRARLVDRSVKKTKAGSAIPVGPAEGECIVRGAASQERDLAMTGSVQFSSPLVEDQESRAGFNALSEVLSVWKLLGQLICSRKEIGNRSLRAEVEAVK
nr:hypothetical protein CFP56_00412 [Quercus suber]